MASKVAGEDQREGKAEKDDPEVWSTGQLRPRPRHRVLSFLVSFAGLLFLLLFLVWKEKNSESDTLGKNHNAQTSVLWVAAPTDATLKDLIPVGFCSFNHISVGLKNGHGSLCV